MKKTRLAALALACLCFAQTTYGADTPTSPAAKSVQQGEQSFSAYITGYSYWDNTPRGSTAIARPVIHRRAGGTGTYRNPVTIAVGHVIEGSRQTLDYPAGTRFYLPRLQRYAIVEDVCGDGNAPQNGPCHSGYRGNPWLDIYIDGRRAGAEAATACAYRLTGLQQIIINSRRGYPVNAGPITESGCEVVTN